jgi:hypothetical protein
MGAPGGGFGAPAAGGWQQQQQPMHMAGGATAFAGAGAAGVDPCQGAVLQIIQASNAEQGVNQTEVCVDGGDDLRAMCTSLWFRVEAAHTAPSAAAASSQVYNKLGGQFNRQVIDNALQTLMAEAHV